MKLIETSRLHEAAEMYEGQNLPVLISQLETYSEKDKRKFIHFVNGGITDNLGLRAVADINVSIQRIKHPETLEFFNAISTNF